MPDLPRLVPTSKGPRLRSQVVEVAGGAHVRRPDQSMEAALAIRNLTAQVATATVTAAPAGGWISWGDWRNTDATPISTFAATWVVPPTPTQNNGQTIYLFNGLQDAGGKHILQPVLQWGPSPASGSGPQWGLASFWVGGSSDPLYCTQWIAVAPGTAVTGRLQVAAQDNGLFSCTCCFDGYPGSQLTAENLPALTDACVVLEAYNTGPAAPFPSVSATDFSAIDVELGAGPTAVAWTSFGGASIVSAADVRVVYPAAVGS
ncbi:MAG: hypothetical protein P4M07_04495 [Xanthobacteraceae bacterium]|nr:hypothetical protein [Xanthobacteraceae bacterium]